MQDIQRALYEEYLAGRDPFLVMSRIHCWAEKARFDIKIASISFPRRIFVKGNFAVRQSSFKLTTLSVNCELCEQERAFLLKDSEAKSFELFWLGFMFVGIGLEMRDTDTEQYTLSEEENNEDPNFNYYIGKDQKTKWKKALPPKMFELAVKILSPIYQG
ncbi:hypothetical protein LAZ67_X000871 [Cordylochernes scorpioides]|uniref:Uncharacterized protein n=1 Tax=Cordylochernes scorpioides TaxID=51811 RepID=A0ABY6LSE5_9ARAC|nr:hypothetical protein LAZ67_X000871 [Cordylochernes scorpioides]